MKHNNIIIANILSPIFKAHKGCKNAGDKNSIVAFHCTARSVNAWPTDSIRMFHQYCMIVLLNRYSIMTSCWVLTSVLRPTFADLVKQLSGYLESLASYVILSDMTGCSVAMDTKV